MKIVLQRLEVELVGMIMLPERVRLDRTVHLNLYPFRELLDLHFGIAAAFDDSTHNKGSLQLTGTLIY